MKLLQVCNVGDICGGTAACAWTITHALPEVEHAVLFLSHPTNETRRAFSHCELMHASQADESTLASSDPDLVVLHNTIPNRIPEIESFLSIQYHHSAGHRTCSEWLAGQIDQTKTVLYQPVPIPPRRVDAVGRLFHEEIRIGRLCTPKIMKWPPALIPFYESLAKTFPDVIWEFVGLPDNMKPDMKTACQGRCRFHTAGFRARSHLWNWHALLYHHPTLTESFGRVVAEAMRAGCVPIVDDQGGFTEQIQARSSGFLCSDISDFATAIQAIHERSFWSEISREARFAADQKSSLEAYRTNFLKLLSNLA